MPQAALRASCAARPQSSKRRSPVALRPALSARHVLGGTYFNPIAPVPPQRVLHLGRARLRVLHGGTVVDAGGGDALHYARLSWAPRRRVVPAQLQLFQQRTGMGGLEPAQHACCARRLDPPVTPPALPLWRIATDSRRVWRICAVCACLKESGRDSSSSRWSYLGLWCGVRVGSRAGGNGDSELAATVRRWLEFGNAGHGSP